MPNRLRKSFRTGNLAEHLGLLLLKGIAAVAEVSRPEDIGLDAVATLLRDDTDGNFYAEESFVVQIKSKSQRMLKYSGHELKWLLAQTQPMFIGHVSLADSEIRLYSTLTVNQAVLALHAEQVRIRFGESKLPPFFGGTETTHWHGSPNNTAEVWLGEPLLAWKISDVSDAQWRSSAYRCLKRFLSLARRELDLLKLGQLSQLLWSTNHADSITTSAILMKGHPSSFNDLAKQSVPTLNALLLNSAGMPPDRADLVVNPLIALIAGMRELGIDVEMPIDKMIAAHRAHRGKQAGTSPS